MEQLQLQWLQQILEFLVKGPRQVRGFKATKSMSIYLASAPVGEYELHAYKSRITVATIGFIVVFRMKSITISFDCIIHANP